jgi:hypothetical protein
MTVFTLTEEQFDFLNQYHEAVCYGRIHATFFNDWRVIESIMALKGYQEIMNGMEWDDVLDRYEDHPRYDDSLRLRLGKQFNTLDIYRRVNRS